MTLKTPLSDFLCRCLQLGGFYQCSYCPLFRSPLLRRAESCRSSHRSTASGRGLAQRSTNRGPAHSGLTLERSNQRSGLSPQLRSTGSRVEMTVTWRRVTVCLCPAIGLRAIFGFGPLGLRFPVWPATKATATVIMERFCGFRYARAALSWRGGVRRCRSVPPGWPRTVSDRGRPGRPGHVRRRVGPVMRPPPLMSGVSGRAGGAAELGGVTRRGGFD